MAGSEQNTIPSAAPAAPQVCTICGKTLDKSHGWKMYKRFGSIYVPFCTSCMERIYRYYSSLLGWKLALFFCCGFFNLPYRPELFKEAKNYKQKGRIGGYILALRANGDDKGEEWKGFADGITDIKEAFNGELDTIHVDDAMLEDDDYLSGKMMQEAMWGKGPEEAPYSEEDYAQMCNYYNALADTRPGASAQTKQAMIKIARWTLEQDRCFDKGDYANVEKLQKIIKDEKENEQLRKKDELPQDTARLDDIVHAVERAGLNIPDPDQLLTMLANHSFHKRYPYTRDAADQVIMSIRNTTAWNEGHAEVASLPPEYAVIDDLDEFAKKPDEIEKKLYKQMELSRMDLKNPAAETKGKGGKK